MEDELEAEAEAEVEVEVKLADEIVAEVVKLADVAATTSEMLETEGAVVAILRTQSQETKWEASESQTEDSQRTPLFVSSLEEF